MTTATKNENRVSDLLDSGVSFNEHFVNLRDMKCIPTKNYKKERGAGSKKNLESVKIEFNGKECFPSNRFWLSFCAKVGVAPSIFNLYDHDEVFDRVIKRGKISISGDIRVVEDVKNNRLLAMSDPAKSVADWRSVLKLVDKKGGEVKEFAEIKEEIVSGLTMLKQQQALMDKIEELFKSADIEIRIELLEE